MNPKTTLGLLVALALAVVGIWWVTSSPEADTIQEPTGPRALFEPALTDLTGFEYKSGSDPSLVFVMEDDHWHMASPITGAGDHSKIKRDVEKICDLKYEFSYTKDDPDRPTPELTSLETPLKVIKLTQKNGDSTVLKIGARQAMSTRTYLQVAGDDTIYLIDSDLNADMKRKLADYRSKRMTEFDKADAIRVEISGEKQYILVKTDGRWMLESPIRGRVNAVKINSVLGSLSNLLASDFVDDNPASLRPYGLERPRVTVKVLTETKTPKPAEEPPTSAPAEPEFDIKQKEIAVAFGGEADNKVFAKMLGEDTPTVFQVVAATVGQVAPPLDDVRDKRVADLVTPRAQRIVASAGDDLVELTKAEDIWNVASDTSNGVPMAAEPAAVEQLLNAVRDLKAIGFEVTPSATHGFDQPRATIEITEEGELQPIKLIIGGNTPSGTGTYVKNETEDFVAVVNAEAIEPLIVKPLSFSSRRIMTFNRIWATAIDVERNDQRMEIALEGGVWKLKKPVEGDAEQLALEAILNNSKDLRARRVVGTHQDAAQFGLEKPLARVTITTMPPPPEEAEDESTSAPMSKEVLLTAIPHTYLVGKANDKVYAMLENGQMIYEVDAKILDDLLVELLNTRVTPIDPAQVKTLTLGVEKAFTFERHDNQWQLVGEPTFATDAEKINELLETIRDLRTDRYVTYAGAARADYGLDHPLAVIRLTADNGETLDLAISATGDTPERRYASTGTAPDRIFTISADQAAVFARQVKEFQQQ